MSLTHAWNQRHRAVRFRLACLVAACVLPVWVIAGYLVHLSFESKRALIERHMLDTARALSLAVDRELAGVQAAVGALVTSPSIAAGDMAAFHGQVQEVLRSYPGSDIIMADETGQQVINSYLPLGTALPRRNVPDAVRRVFETGRPGVSNLFKGAVTGRALISVDTPVFVHGRAVYDLGITMPAARFAALLEEATLPPEWLGTVLDANLVIVARTSGQEHLVGKPLKASSQLRKLAGEVQGTLDTVNAEGVPVLAAFNRSGGSNWTVVIGVPKRVMMAELMQWLRWTLGGTALLSVAGVGLALFMGRRIAGSIKDLIPPAMALGSGEPVAASRTALRETDEVAKALVAASGLLKRRDEERESAEALRAKAEEQLRERERIFRIVADNSYNWEYWAGPDGTFQWVSPACLRITGYPPEEFTQAGGSSGRTIRSLVHPEDLPAWDAHAAADAARGPAHPEIELRIIKRGGETTYISHACEPVHARDGAYLGRRGCNRDISEQKRGEDALRSAKEMAESASRSKSEFLANMSHEIRTPLNGTLGLLQLLVETPLSEEQNGFVHLALKSGNSLLSVLNDILDFSKIEAGKLAVDEKPLSIAELLGAVRDLFGEQAGQAGLQLACEAGAGVPLAVLGDFARLRQVLFNLVGNSVKFTPAGEIRVSVEADPVGERLVFAVSDTGIGMPGEKVDALFEPFVQADGSYTRKQRGVGLGLAIVKRLVTLMGGGLHAQSQPGRGTTITFDIPLKLAGAAPARQAACPPSFAFKGQAILLAEDEAVNRLIMRSLLENRGFTVHCAGNGLEALSILDRERIDAVLMDIQMPEMDGVQAARAIRDPGRFGDKSRVPVIALTAHAMAGDKERFLAAGMDDYISKPVDLGQLLCVLSRFLKT